MAYQRKWETVEEWARRLGMLRQVRAYQKRMLKKQMSRIKKKMKAIKKR